MAKLPRRPAYVRGAAASAVARRELTAHSARAACWREVGEAASSSVHQSPAGSGELGEGARGGVDVEQRPDHDDGAERRRVCGDVCGEKAVRLGAQR
jgi:hypothetical protein